MDVSFGICHDCRNELTHRHLQVISLLVDVERIGRGKETYRCMNVAWMATLRVLFDHKARDWASLNDVLHDRRNNLV